MDIGLLGHYQHTFLRDIFWPGNVLFVKHINTFAEMITFKMSPLYKKTYIKIRIPTSSAFQRPCHSLNNIVQRLARSNKDKLSYVIYIKRGIFLSSGRI